MNDIRFFHGPQADLEQIKIVVLRTKLSKIELVLKFMRLIQTRLIDFGFGKCLKVL